MSYKQEVLHTDLLDGWSRSDPLFYDEKHQESSSTVNKYLYNKIIIDMVFHPFIICSTLKENNRQILAIAFRNVDWKT